MTAPHIAQAQTHFVPVNHRGGWLHVRIVDSNGITGWGEASHSGDDQRVAKILQPLLKSMIGRRAGPHLLLNLSDAPATDKCHWTAGSGLEQAFVDLACRQAGHSVAQCLSGVPTADDASVAVYTNLNRMCKDRSPVTVARAARTALDHGVNRFKFAPFDEVSVQALRAHGANAAALIEPGLRRLEALRDAAGSGAHLMVDCHWRFTPQALPWLEKIVRAIGIEWIEDPVPDLNRAIANQLRDQTGALIAGGEHLITFNDFENYAQSSGADVLIADVKHVGGIRAMHKIAQLASDNGLKFAPHNPSGPISTAASAHVSYANTNVDVLEYPFGEIAWRGQLAKQERLTADRIRVCGPGLGVNLDLSAVPV